MCWRKFETVDQVPKAYFDEHRSLYAYVERIIDGDTVRVRHIPAYRFRLWSPSPLQQRGIANDTLIVRIYGVDCPELAKNGNKGQAFAQEAKQFTSDLLYHRMVKITFLRKDQYRRAVAVVETLGRGGPLLSWIPGLRPRDVSVELAAAGLAELYTGGGAEYNNKRDLLERKIAAAQQAKRGIWSLGRQRESAAEYKKNGARQAQPTRFPQPAFKPVASTGNFASKQSKERGAKVLDSVVTGLELAAG